MALREARLKPESEHLYPGIMPGVWTVASQLVPQVLRLRLQQQPTWEFTRRVLDDDHFEFRGGKPREPQWNGVPSRVEDA